MPDSVSGIWIVEQGLGANERWSEALDAEIKAAASRFDLQLFVPVTFQPALVTQAELQQAAAQQAAAQHAANLAAYGQPQVAPQAAAPAQPAFGHPGFGGPAAPSGPVLTPTPGFAQNAHDDALELGAGHEAPSAAFGMPPIQGRPAKPVHGGDELLLDASSLMDDEPPFSQRRRPLVAPAAAPAPAPEPRATGGSTLFERMANLTGRRKAEEDDGDGPEDPGAISIPRFLGRQNNQ